jgi:hypothetical protein
MEPEGSLSCSQEPSTGPYPEPDPKELKYPSLRTPFIKRTEFLQISY